MTFDIIIEVGGGFIKRDDFDIKYVKSIIMEDYSSQLLSKNNILYPKTLTYIKSIYRNIQIDNIEDETA